jgi:hypothetical protein
MFKINLPNTENYITGQYSEKLFVKHESTMEIDLDYFEESIQKINNFCHNFSKLSQYEIQDYFEKLLSNKININCINGIITEVSKPVLYYCDYCGFIISGDYYYCYECHKDICNTCYENKINSTCISHDYNNIKKRKECDYNDYQIICNLCDNKIIDPMFYSDEEDMNSLDDTYDLCMDCVSKNSGLIEQNSLKKIILKFPCDNCSFDNMIDWIPVLKDNENSFILINKNTMQYCLFCRNSYNKYGYYVISLEKLNSFINQKGFMITIIYSILLDMKVTSFLI